MTPNTPVHQIVPPLAEMMQVTSTVTFYETPNRLPEQFEQTLSQKFHVRYLWIVNFEAPRRWPPIQLPKSISTKDIRNISEEDFGSFTVRTYYNKFSDFQSAADRNLFLSTIPKYFKENIFGKGYFKDGKLVGVIVTHLNAKHSVLNKATLHIGYWGYERDLVTIEEARSIKVDWLTEFANWSGQLGGIPVEGSVDWFNRAAYKMTKQMGFNQICLRLDRKCD